MTAEAAGRALRRLGDVLARQGAPVIDRRPLGADEVRSAIAAAGLTPPEDVVAWWTWVGIPPADEGWACFVTPRHRLVPLDRAVAVYRQWVAPDDAAERGLLADHGWFPLAQLGHGGLVVAGCSDPGVDSVTVRTWNADSGVGGSGASLATAAGWWADHLESGAWTWRGARWEDTLDDDMLPGDQQYSFLV